MKKKVLFFTALTLLLASACSNEDSINKIDNKPNEKAILGVSANMDISQTTSTRELITGLVSGDKLGVFIDDAETTTSTYSPNAYSTYMYNGSIWSLEGDTKQFLASTVANVYSFFPIQTVGEGTDIVADCNNKTIPVKVLGTINNFATTGQTDYMYGTDRAGTEGSYTYDALPKASNAAKDSQDPLTYNSEVDIYLHHALAKLSFVVTKDANYSGEGKITKIELWANNGADPAVEQTLFSSGDAGTMNLEATPVARFAGLDAISSLIMEDTNGVKANDPDGTEVKAKLLMAPAEITSPNIVTLKITIDDKEMSSDLTLPANSKFEGGKNYGYTITVSPTNLTIKNVTLIDWTDETIATIDVN